MCLTLKNRKEKKRIESHCFALKPEHGPRGIWQKPLKPGALSQLVGSHRLSVRYTSGWVEFSELYVLKARNHSKSRVKPIEFVVERSSWLDTLDLHWLGVVGESPLHGLW